jgi:hypothetical protein
MLGNTIERENSFPEHYVYDTTDDEEETWNKKQNLAEVETSNKKRKLAEKTANHKRNIKIDTFHALF